MLSGISLWPSGLEGAMWSELIRTADQMHGMIFPRLLALAERAWHKASDFDEDWVKFVNTLGYRELARLDKMGVAYRVPPPVARFDLIMWLVSILYKSQCCS